MYVSVVGTQGVCLSGGWLNSPVLKPMKSFGVVAGKVLVDPKDDIIFIPVMNPGDSVVVLPRHAVLAFLIPIEQVGRPVTAEHCSESNSSKQTGSAHVGKTKEAILPVERAGGGVWSGE